MYEIFEGFILSQLHNNNSIQYSNNNNKFIYINSYPFIYVTCIKSKREDIKCDMSS